MFHLQVDREVVTTPCEDTGKTCYKNGLVRRGLTKGFLLDVICNKKASYIQRWLIVRSYSTCSGGLYTAQQKFPNSRFNDPNLIILIFQRENKGCQKINTLFLHILKPHSLESLTNARNMVFLLRVDQDFKMTPIDRTYTHCSSQ